MLGAELEKRVRDELERQGDIDKRLNGVVEDLVSQASAELHEFVQTVKKYLDDLREQSKQSGATLEYADAVLDLQCIKLPVLMYFAADYMEKWGLYSDVSKAEWQESYDQAALETGQADGRVVDMEIAGRRAAQVQDWTHKIKSRVYSRLKTRLKYADEIFNRLRKVSTKRITELEVFRREQAARMGRTYEGDD